MRTLSVWLVLTMPLFANAAGLGQHIDDFKLQDGQGDWHALSNLAERRAVVIVFVGAECPVVQQFAPRLAALAAEYEPRGVGFLAIDANEQDSPAEIAQFARSHKLALPVLKDPRATIADRFGAKRTPEAFVLDAQRTIRYRGRIDDQFGVGYMRPKPTRRDLAVAIDEVLAGADVSVAETEPVGCHIGRTARKPPQGDITYAKHVAPILQKHCVVCHRPGQVAPFSLTQYHEVSSWAETIREAVDADRMPPWHANPEFGHFSNDSRLSADEKRVVDEWVENGLPEGDPADLPPPPQYSGDWSIPEPDLVVNMPEPFNVPAKGTVPYKFFRTDISFDEDRWVIGAEGRPGNRAVVHHMLLFFVPPGTKQISPEMPFFNVLGAYVPGLPTGLLPTGIARRIPAGSKLAFQLHYTPNGSEQVDQSSVGLVFTDAKNVKKSLEVNMALNFLFRIPPGAKDYRVEASHRFAEDTLLFTLQPHMHLRGKAFRFDAIYPDGSTETLLDVPRYDFNWQMTYALAEPKRLPEGTTLHCLAAFDNSAENRVNPDPGATVRWGDQTWEEMMIGAFDSFPADQDLSLGRPRVVERGENFEVHFRYRPTVAARTVHLSGTFNEWQPTATPLDGPDADGFYSTTRMLPPGRHEYKFVLDGTAWRADPGNPEIGKNRNSVLRLGE
ncbi:MAG TPA: redoxin domain-containing protein [Pirellulales bacterium]|nr:redoxin domain-containing protein [Pirellulales bacterium]